MKYLKIFEDYENNNTKSLDDVQEFCNLNLSYLLDDDFKIITNNVEHQEYNDIHINISKLDDSKFTWNDVKDYIIPFIEIIDNKYHLENNIVFIDIEYDIIIHTIDEVLNDDVLNETFLSKISMSIPN